MVDRAPGVKSVIDEIKTSEKVKTIVEHSPVFADVNHNALLSRDIWQEIHSKIISAILASAVTVEKEAKKASLKYVRDCATIDAYAATLVEHDAFSSINISELSV